MTTAPSNSAPALATRLAFIASFLGVGMIAPWAPAQATLDLRPPASAPAPGSGLGAPALAQAMRLEAQRIARESPDDAGAARAAMRSLAADLLESGEAMGETGSIRVVLARTIVRGLDELDASIGALAGDDADARAVALRLLASDCDGARAALKNATADPWRAVRDSLSVLSRAANATPTGWPEASDADKPEGDVPGVESIRGTLSKIPGVSADARAAAEPALALIAEVDDHSPSWPAARHLRRAIARSAEVLANRPAWLPTLLIVKVLPIRFSRAMERSRAAAAVPAICRAISITPSASQSRITGTISPDSVSVAMPMCTARCWMIDAS